MEVSKENNSLRFRAYSGDVELVFICGSTKRKAKAKLALSPVVNFDYV